MARRASAQTFLKRNGTAAAPVYFLAGGYEFAASRGYSPPSAKRLAFLAKAFDLLHHDILFVTPEERALIAKAGIKPHAGWVGGSERLETHILQSGGGPKIGVLILPPLSATAKSVPQSYIQQVENTVYRLRESTQLVVAMSPWGYMHEQELLAAQGPLPDILLGSGPGMGMVGVPSAGGKTLWARSFLEGKSVLRIEILDWPARNSTFKWTEDKNIRMTLFGLTDDYQENPQMLTLMQRMGTD